ncbi:xanthine dehydrogenase accessory protein XdhC [Thalassotalea fusca]
MMNWSKATYKLAKQGKAYVLVTVIGVTGSTPRNNGTKMVVTNDALHDTIGGGHLEHVSIKFARHLLVNNQDSQQLEHFQLGSQLGQCCGGSASVLFECFAASEVNIMLFGAGHVGQALIPMLAALPVQVTWVDSRESQFPEHFDQINSHGNIQRVVSEQPEDEVALMPANSYYIVMTHNHQMDFEITQSILKRGDFGYLGLIASDTKWRRFQQRFKHREISPELVQRMHCPIGLPDVTGKLPMEVAVSVAAQVISIYQQQAFAQQAINRTTNDQENVKGSHKGVSWKALAASLQAAESPSEQNESSVSQNGEASGLTETPESPEAQLSFKAPTRHSS